MASFKAFCGQMIEPLKKPRQIYDLYPICGLQCFGPLNYDLRKL